jgi:hypothetical protein
MTVWILWVLVIADGEWRAWEHEYTTHAACEEVRKVIIHHRELQIQAVCRIKE